MELIDVALVPVTGKGRQCPFLYRLLKFRPKEACISHEEMPTYREHRAFVFERPYTAWYIITRNGRSAGSVYLTNNDEIGVAVVPEHQGEGLASSAIHRLMWLHPRNQYLANVAPDNEASHKLFSKLGKIIQHTYRIRIRRCP